MELDFLLSNIRHYGFFFIRIYLKINTFKTNDKLKEKQLKSNCKATDVNDVIGYISYNRTYLIHDLSLTKLKRNLSKNTPDYTFDFMFGIEIPALSRIQFKNIK